MPDIAKIKRNVKRMVDQGAPEQDIDQYLAGEGVTPEQLKAQNLDPAQVPPRNPEMSIMEGIRGVGKEMLGGIPVAGPALVGLGDRVTAGARSLMGGDSYGQELESLQTQQEDFARRHPNIDRSARNAGAIGGTALLGAAMPQAMGLRGGAGALGFLKRSLASGGSNATIFGADAAVRGEDPVAAAEVGGAFGLLAPAAGQGVGTAVRKTFTRRGPLPSIDDMYANKKFAYTAVDRMGARYSEQAYDDLVVSMRKEAAKMHMNVMRHPRVASMLDDMEKAKATWENPGAPTLTELDQLRQIIRRDVVKTGDEAEAEFGDMMMDRIDDFFERSPPIGGGAPAASRGGGNVQAAYAAIKQARLLNTRLRKAEILEDAVDRAQRAAAVSGSGGNAENTLRQAINRILNNPNKLRSFTNEEREIMHKIASPKSKMQDMVRLMGGLSPTTGKLMATLQLGAAAFNPYLAVPAVGGIIAKGVSEGMTTGRVNKLQQLVRTGSAAAPVPGPKTQLSAEAMKRLSHALTLGVPLANYR